MLRELEWREIRLALFEYTAVTLAGLLRELAAHFGDLSDEANARAALDALGDLIEHDPEAYARFGPALSRACAEIERRHRH
jgi:hypothetical protein